ncbi:sodium pump decarboxylase subunit gamma [Billgrantia pellis]|uniref:Probable oxaloacetate decarboxylase gamma chain n=1 Tax=Billgrantia pellis TaxID=2606936 RepID=A0A7V7FZP4_9GAMM|nr:OadG family transporter subunit [Halomonas pellis]KAA0012069.1 sodium pump decarboxylase subunit gamma [Halomonas pellis]
MQDMQLLLDGLALMGVGMGFVFAFLTILVGVTALMSQVIRRLAPAPAQPAPIPAPASSDKADDAQVMAVLSAAVHRYRRRHRR